MASQGVNKVILIGNLGRDPEIRYTGSGTAVANLSLATTRRYKDRDGNQQEETEWHRLVMWARLAEIAGEYLRKGSQIYVEGRLKTNKWQDNNGNDRFTTEVVCNEMQMLGSPSGNGGQGGSSGSGQGAPAQNQGQAPDQEPATEGEFDQDFEGIPF